MNGPEQYAEIFAAINYTLLLAGFAVATVVIGALAEYILDRLGVL